MEGNLMMNPRPPRMVLLATLMLALCGSAQAQPLPFAFGNGSMGAAPDYLSPGFIGPRTPDQQREYDAAQSAGAQDALKTIADPCTPWRIPCKLPDDAKIGKNDGFVDPPAGETWIKTPAGWNRCTASMCDAKSSSCADNPSIAPCKAEEERKKKEATEAAFQKANDNMFKKKGDATQTGFSIASNDGQKTNAGIPESDSFGMLSDDGSSLDTPTDGDGHGVDRNSGNLLGKAIANDVLKSQPDSSLLSANNAGPNGEQTIGTTPAGDWRGVDNAVKALSNVTDNGNSVSVGGPGGMSGISPDKHSALGAAQGMGAQAAISGSSVWDDFWNWADKFGGKGAPVSSDPTVLERSRKSQSKLFGQKDHPQGPQD